MGLHMTTKFSTSDAGFELIKRFEGCEKRLPDNRLQAYKIGADPWTIGWGQTGQMPDGRRVESGLIITQQEADDALQFFVRNVVDPLVRKHFVVRTQNEHDACASWVYNIRHDRLERGDYSLPQLVNMKSRDIEAIANRWLQYVATPGFENGLYRRRIAEVLMFMGLPWNVPAIWGYVSTAIYKRAGQVNPTDPWFIFDMAQSLASPPVPAEPVLPPPAPEPAPKAETPPAATPEAPAPIVEKKPPAASTKKPEEVGLDPNAGLKHINESDRAKGWFWQNFGRIMLRFSALGLFGNTMALGATTLMADQMLMHAIFELWVPLAVNGSTLASGYVAYWYGQWKEDYGRRVGSQAIYI